MTTISMTPIGHVRSTRRDIADDNWDAEGVSIELDASQFSREAFLGLSEFSHVEILFYMDKVDPAKIEHEARYPRNNPDWPKVGIFAQRGKNRPNQIGATICRVKNVDGLKLYVEGLDAVDGTPVLDIKPWVEEFAPRGPRKQPAWITELMRGYWSEANEINQRLPWSFMISGINHVTLCVTNLDEAFDFYQSVLGLKPLAKRENKSAYFLAGQDWIALVQAKDNQLKSYAHLALSVSPDEFINAASKIKSSGAKIWQENSSPGDSLYFLDPSGNRLEIHAGDWKSRLRWLKENPSDDVKLFLDERN